MKKNLLIFTLFLFLIKINSQQKINWGEVLYGDIKALKANKIKTLSLKNKNKVLRSVEVVSDNSILVKDSLFSNYFYFDHESRVVSIKSAKDNLPHSLTFNYNNNFVEKISRSFFDNGIKSFTQFSKVSFNNDLYEEKEIYNFYKGKNDSLCIFRTKYFFNQETPDLSYKQTYENGKVWKKYFNNTEVRQEKFGNYYTVDSVLQKDHKNVRYHFENYPDRQLIKIEADSIFTIQKRSGKKVSEKLEYAYLPFKEIFYDENENIKEKIIYKNYRNAFDELALWEVRKYNGKGKLKSRKLPNKDIYKLNNGVLEYRMNVSRINMRDQAYHEQRLRSFYGYYINLFSPSILFSLKLARNFSDNFDTSVFEGDNDLIYANIDFADNANIIYDYSASKDVKEELFRTSKSVRKGRFGLKFFTDLEVEAETFTGKKYKINLSQNPELLSFPIHTILIKPE